MSESRIPEWVRPGVWGAVVGAIAISVIGFSAGWVVTAGTADERAETEAQTAVIAALTPVCVAQFRKLDAQQEKTHLAALQEERSWQRGDYVEDQGWATMPGSDQVNDEVADACASELVRAATDA